jgi:Uncharacterized protein conserved in bacteria (DUF2188)
LANGVIHTVHRNGEWINEVDNGLRFGSGYATKEEAVSAGRERAQHDASEHVIHNQDGTISERNSYGGDRRVDG